MDIMRLGRSTHKPIGTYAATAMISRSERKLNMSPQKTRVLAVLSPLPLFFWGIRWWNGEILGGVFYDVYLDSSLGPEDHTLEGAEVAVLCITKSGESSTTRSLRTQREGPKSQRQCWRASGGTLALNDPSTVSASTALILGMEALG